MFKVGVFSLVCLVLVAIFLVINPDNLTEKISEKIESGFVLISGESKSDDEEENSPDPVGQNKNTVKAENSSSNPQSSSSNGFASSTLFAIALGVVFMMLLGLCIVTMLLFKQLRWRQRHLNGETVVLQDAYIDFIDGLKDRFSNLQEKLDSYTIKTSAAHLASSTSIEELKKSVIQLNTVIDSQQKEIGRYKKGYDLAIRKGTMFAFIELKELVDGLLHEQNNEEVVEKLGKVSAYVESFFEEFEIEDFKIPAGESTRGEVWQGWFDIVDSELSNDEELIDTFSDTVRVGYSLGSGTDRVILKKAKVKAYVRGEK